MLLNDNFLVLQNEKKKCSSNIVNLYCSILARISRKLIFYIQNNIESQMSNIFIFLKLKTNLKKLKLPIAQKKKNSTRRKNTKNNE